MKTISKQFLVAGLLLSCALAKAYAPNPDVEEAIQTRLSKLGMNIEKIEANIGPWQVVYNVFDNIDVLFKNSYDIATAVTAKVTLNDQSTFYCPKIILVREDVPNQGVQTRIVLFNCDLSGLEN